MKIGSKTFNFPETTAIMAIVNATPDSFYEKSRTTLSEETAVYIASLETKGVDIIDIGGESTRPGSAPVSVEAELERVIPLVETACRISSLPLSVDTTKAEVAERAINAGASMINDISALTFDTAMVDVVRNNNVPIVLMHMKGTPLTMQDNPFYDDPVAEIAEWLLKRAAWAEKKGIPAENIILDPGIGFGKRVSDNIKLIRGFAAEIRNRYPVLVGHSRKKFIGEITGRTSPSERLYGSIGVAVMATYYGASILRVHDPEETRDAIVAAKAI